MKHNQRIKENAYKIKENDDNKAEMIFQDVIERTARICCEKLLSNEKFRGGSTSFSKQVPG